MHLGRLQKVDLREVWLSEPTDFTPWLAQEDNLALLSETLGMELELVAQEQGVGPFRADIVCTDGLAESTVLIENQLERTDHRHLGQLLTYAAGLEAVSIVWIAQNFAEEHRAALDWLNNHTSEDLRFFGLEVELWRIGDSHVAPKFNVVSKPNEWVKHKVNQPTTSEAGQVYLEYWQAFGKLVDGMDCQFAAPSPTSRHHVGFRIGRTGVSISAVASTYWRRINAELYLGGDRAKSRFHQLLADRNAIEAEYGAKLDWQELPDKTASRIAMAKHDCDIEDRSQWPDQHAWLVEQLNRFHSVFRPRVARLKDDGTPSTPADAELE